MTANVKKKNRGLWAGCCLLIAAPLLAQPPGRDAAIAAKTHVCNHTGTLTCGQTVNGSLGAQDCRLEDGSFIDFWEFEGTFGQTVTVAMTSDQVDSFLFLLDPSPQTVATDDDSGGGRNARITNVRLTSSGTWTIGANSATVNETGSYTLSLACSGTGGGGAPAAPSNLSAKALSSSEVELSWEDNATNETSFRIEARSEGGSFQEIDSAEINTDQKTITGLQPETAYTFRLRARNATGDSPPSNEATVTTPPDPAAEGFLTTAAFPNFRFRVRIFQQVEPLLGHKENACLPETLCVSGAISGRSEVFLRVIGPRPNGYLWPTVVRFTPSRVEVEIRQVSTGITKTYVLPAVTPEATNVSGLQDRMGFLP